MEIIRILGYSFIFGTLLSLVFGAVLSRGNEKERKKAKACCILAGIFAILSVILLVNPEAKDENNPDVKIQELTWQEEALKSFINREIVTGMQWWNDANSLNRMEMERMLKRIGSDMGPDKLINDLRRKKWLSQYAPNMPDNFSATMGLTFKRQMRSTPRSNKGVKLSWQDESLWKFLNYQFVSGKMMWWSHSGVVNKFEIEKMLNRIGVDMDPEKLSRDLWAKKWICQYAPDLPDEISITDDLTTYTSRAMKPVQITTGTLSQ